MYVSCIYIYWKRFGHIDKGTYYGIVAARVSTYLGYSNLDFNDFFLSDFQLVLIFGCFEYIHVYVGVDRVA